MPEILRRYQTQTGWYARVRLTDGSVVELKFSKRLHPDRPTNVEFLELAVRLERANDPVVAVEAEDGTIIPPNPELPQLSIALTPQQREWAIGVLTTLRDHYRPVVARWGLLKRWQQRLVLEHSPLLDAAAQFFGGVDDGA